ncbi:hypothetical protein BU26DRAFT_12931 [Trematosphaeria pertusa]|uniref:Uncharacterized protein n=1 Tax=Trematosphaeria pertusa TaxID=390896 RepID=A0A6A6J242_9PLEO|nr:uncharacterized protein BU26DRAFT_12931 [Trematosphaeria pertusa]KAF2255980.1 hypothetical protein BU26DRAFT_12931 [Trematosphaeria pertusa]
MSPEKPADIVSMNEGFRASSHLPTTRLDAGTAAHVQSTTSLGRTCALVAAMLRLSGGPATTRKLAACSSSNIDSHRPPGVRREVKGPISLLRDPFPCCETHFLVARPISLLRDPSQHPRQTGRVENQHTCCGKCARNGVPTAGVALDDGMLDWGFAEPMRDPKNAWNLCQPVYATTPRMEPHEDKFTGIRGACKSVFNRSRGNSFALFRASPRGRGHSREA